MPWQRPAPATTGRVFFEGGELLVGRARFAPLRTVPRWLHGVYPEKIVIPCLRGRHAGAKRGVSRPHVPLARDKRRRVSAILASGRGTRRWCPGRSLLLLARPNSVPLWAKLFQILDGPGDYLSHNWAGLPGQLGSITGTATAHGCGLPLQWTHRPARVQGQRQPVQRYEP